MSDQQQQRAIAQGVVRTASSTIIKSSAEAAAYNSIDIFSALIRFGTNLGMTISNALSQKKKKEKKEKLDASKLTSANAINAVLSDIYEYGLSLIEQTDLSPRDPQFEVMLTGLISELTGYHGKCEADVFAPESKILWFKVRGGKVIPEPGVVLPDNADTLWTTGCRNLQDQWMIAYQNKLLSQKRAGEIQNIRGAHTRNQWGVSIGLGVLTAGLGLYLLHTMIQTTRVR